MRATNAIQQTKSFFIKPAEERIKPPGNLGKKKRQISGGDKTKQV